MKYIEKHVGYTRIFELRDKEIFLKGEGIIIPSYEMTFIYKELNPRVQLLKIGNRFTFMPLVLTTAVITAIFLLSMAGTGYLPDIIPMIFLFSTVFLCICTVVSIFYKSWWVTYVNNSGIPCFSFHKTAKRAKELEIFQSELDKRIINAQT